jgi:metallo-beta-lactamase class B
MTGPANESPTGPISWWHRRLPRLILLVAVALGIAAVVWWRPRPGFTPRPAKISTVLQRAAVALAPGVYLLGKTEPGVAYFVETSQGLVLIDSGIEDNAAVVISQIAELGFDVKQLRAVLLTHAHADHSLGAEYLRRLTGAKIYAGRADVPPLRQGGPRDAFFSIYYMPQVQAHPTTVDVELADGDLIDFAETRFVAVATPGHSTGSVCYAMERPDLRALFTGDVVQSLSFGRGALGTYTAYLPPRYRGDAGDFLASLRRLKTLPAPELVLPGHPNSDPSPQRPRLTEKHWHALLDQGIAEMETLVVRYKADGADFLDGTPRELRPGLHYFGDLGGRAVYCLDAPKGLFLFDAPGGTGLVEFLAGRFRKLGWTGRKAAVVLLTSADEEATSGLAALVQEMGCRVVVGKAGLDAVRRRCPAGTAVVSEEEVGFPGKAIPLEGRGLAPVAYAFCWTGKTVLVSGRIPIGKKSPPEAMRLLDDLKAPGGDAARYVQSLGRLAEVNPQVWLPAVPVHGQNANLYDEDWAEILGQNRQLLARNVKRG